MTERVKNVFGIIARLSKITSSINAMTGKTRNQTEIGFILLILNFTGYKTVPIKNPRISNSILNRHLIYDPVNEMT